MSIVLDIDAKVGKEWKVSYLLSEFVLTSKLARTAIRYNAFVRSKDNGVSGAIRFSRFVPRGYLFFVKKSRSIFPSGKTMFYDFKSYNYGMLFIPHGILSDMSEHRNPNGSLSNIFRSDIPFSFSSKDIFDLISRRDFIWVKSDLFVYWNNKSKKRKVVRRKSRKGTYLLK